MKADRLLEERARGGYRLRTGWRPGLASRVHRVAEIPVAHWPETGGVDVSDVTRQKRANLLKGRKGSRHVAQLEEPAQGLGIRLGRHEPAPQDGAHIGGEDDPGAILRGVERLDAEPVTPKEQAGPGRGFEE